MAPLERNSVTFGQAVTTLAQAGKTLDLMTNYMDELGLRPDISPTCQLTTCTAVPHFQPPMQELDSVFKKYSATKSKGRINSGSIGYPTISRMLVATISLKQDCLASPDLCFHGWIYVPYGALSSEAQSLFGKRNGANSDTREHVK